MSSSLKLVAQVSLIPTGCLGVLAMIFALCFDVGEVGMKFRSVVGGSMIGVSVWFSWFVSWYVLGWFVLDMVPLDNSVVLLSVLGNSTFSMLWFVVVLEILRSEAVSKNFALVQIGFHRVVLFVWLACALVISWYAWRLEVLLFLSFVVMQTVVWELLLIRQVVIKLFEGDLGF